MARSTFTWLRAAALITFATQTVAQQCYYPGGNQADASEKPCSSEEGSACCPDTWQCLDNGLCYNPNANIYGRYSCTDQSWNSPGCASNLCIYNPRQRGAEAISQCSNHNNQWCCDANREDVNCCQESPSPRPFFQLQDGRAYATIGRNQASSNPTLSSITGLATGSGGGSPASRTPAPSSSRTPSSANAAGESSRASDSATPTPVTSVSRSVSSGPAGVVTVERTIVSIPTAAAGADPGTGTSSSSGSSFNRGLVIGCSIGLPSALAFLGILLWLLRKRRNQKKANGNKETPEMEGSPTPGFAGGAGAELGKDTYRHSRPGTSEIDGAPIRPGQEIDGSPIGPGQAVSNLPGRAELGSGSGFQPGYGTAYAPDTVGLGGGTGEGRSTWGSAPPSYSPGMGQTAFVQAPNATELADTSVLPVMNEKAGAQPQQYQAYHPPQPVAELPAMKTPPEDFEKQLQK